ncbi:cytoplasmic polyadenylation element-binding protein 1-like isoform X2 [Mytilus trossulus]|uniref:cytoplasmic polyadenylation element-binding protein 1-like isoform X2 n=1 Tax=Mytilus trossulus TaxID=6551 RepID=UPI003004AE6A
MNSDIPAISVEDYEAQNHYHNVDLFKSINALLNNTLDLSSIPGMNIQQEQQKPTMPQMPLQMPQTSHEQVPVSSYDQSIYNNMSAIYPGLHLFSVPASQQQQQQQQQTVPQSSLYSYKPADMYQTPQKYSRAIKGPDRSPSTPSDYGTSSPNSTMNDTLSPVEKILYSNLISGSRRSTSPADSDTSGISSEGSEAALIDMMHSLNMGNRTKQQQQQQQQQQIQPQQTHADVAAQLFQAQQQQQALSTQQQLQALQQQREGTGASQMVQTSRGYSVINPFLMANVDPYAIDRAARLHRNAAAMCEASCTWSGQLPPRNHKNPTYSCKVFLGGVPWDITESGLQTSFGKFGAFKIEWPGKDGYVYLLFESEKGVRGLLQDCTHDFSSGDYYYKISSRRMRAKEVQVIPWVLSDSNYVRQPSQRLDSNKTVFVGALHGMMNAEALGCIMNDLFGNVVYGGIDTDKHKYPIGSGRVTFNSKKSYMKAVQAAFVEIKTPKFTKKIQIDPYLEDSMCSSCGIQQGPYFCREMVCFKYFCRTCWYWQHALDSLRHHKPVTRNTKTSNIIAAASINGIDM